MREDGIREMARKIVVRGRDEVSERGGKVSFSSQEIAVCRNALVSSIRPTRLNFDGIHAGGFDATRNRVTVLVMVVVGLLHFCFSRFAPLFPGNRTLVGIDNEEKK